MKKLKTWDEVRKDFHFTREEEEEIRLEKELIEATIAIRKKLGLTQTELGKKSGIKQPNIAKIENFSRSPQVDTLLKLLVAMGYTLRVVPLENKKK